MTQTSKSRPKLTTRDKYLRAKYGITEATYKAMLAQGDGACWICKRKPLPVPTAVSIDGIGDLAGADLGPGGLGRKALHPRQYGGRPGMVVFASSDISDHGRLLHVSMSFEARDPTWD